MADRRPRHANGEEAPGNARLTPEAFADRFESAWRALWCIAAAVLGNRAGADDVLQEAAMIALGKLSQFDPESNFMAWMGKIVRYTALNHARRLHGGKAESVDPHALESTADNGPQSSSATLNGRGVMIAGQDDFDDRVLTALNSLDDTARACLLLRTLMDMPYKEISLALDLAEGTAMSHVHRARTALRIRLSALDSISGSLPASTSRGQVQHHES